MPKVGCYLCKYLEWYEADYEEFCDSGWECTGRNDEPHLSFKEFPCLRKLNCRELREE